VRYYHATLAIAVGAVLAATGCGESWHVDDIIDASQARVRPWTEPRIFSTQGKVVINPYSFNPAAESDENGLLKRREDSLYYQAADTRDPIQAKQARNRLQFAMLSTSDLAVGAHLSRIKSGKVVPNLVLGGATLGLTGLSSVSSLGTAQALAAAAAGTTGARELYNDETFRNALVESLVKLVESDRRVYLEKVIQVRRTQSVFEYDVDQALRDAMEYHNRGSFYHGLMLVREAADQAGHEKEEVAKAEQEAQKAVIQAQNPVAAAPVPAFPPFLARLDSRGGRILVTEVNPNGRAERMQLKVGDQVLRVNHFAVFTPAEATRLIGQATNGPLVLLIQRDRAITELRDGQ
jgi:hypothetical protein